MPIPNYSDTLGSALGPGITVVQGGDFFSDDDDSDTSLNIDRMNKEIASTAMSDDIVFVHDAAPEDLPLQAFLDSREHHR